MTDTSKLSKKELEELVSSLQARLASQSDGGTIRPDVSKAVKEGKEKSSIMVLRGVHANPRNTVNMYPSQFARLLSQLPSIITTMLEPELWSRFSCRDDAERAKTHAFLTAYLAELKGGQA